MFLKKVFFLPDVEIFIGFLVLEEQFKMLEQRFFPTGVYLSLKSMITIQLIPVCSMKQTFPAAINKSRTVGCTYFAMT